jgi:uncharacterized protein YbaP (TraB family)
MQFFLFFTCLFVSSLCNASYSSNNLVKLTYFEIVDVNNKVVIKVVPSLHAGIDRSEVGRFAHHLLEGASILLLEGDPTNSEWSAQYNSEMVSVENNHSKIETIRAEIQHFIRVNHFAFGFSNEAIDSIPEYGIWNLQVALSGVCFVTAVQKGEGIEKHFSRVAAQRGIPKAVFEAPQVALDWFKNTEPYDWLVALEAIKKQRLDNDCVDKGFVKFQAIKKAFFAGNFTKMDKLSASFNAYGGPRIRIFDLAQSNATRNRNAAKVLVEASTRTNGTVVATMGALHFVGSKTLQAEFRALGMKVRQRSFKIETAGES